MRGKVIYNRRSRAFTLLELLVAMTVLVILVLLLMNMVDSATKLWRSNENRVDAYREPRAALGVISRDIWNALPWTNTNGFRVNPANYVPVGAISGTNYSHMFFLSTLPKEAQWTTNANANGSDVCEVGYFVGYGKTSASTNNALTDTLNLYRFFLSSTDTYSNLNLSTNTAWYPFSDPSSLTTTHRTVELLARNIVSFKVSAFSSTKVTNVSTGVVAESLQNFVQTAARPMPDIVEITITAVNQDTARKLPNSGSWANTNTQPIKENLQSFTTRLRLENVP